MCFLECSKRNDKDLYTYYVVLSTKNPEHSDQPRLLSATENDRNLLTTSMGTGLLENCVLCAHCKILHRQERNKLLGLELFIKIVHSSPPFARLQIRPLSPCKAIPLQFFVLLLQQSHFPMSKVIIR